MSTPIKPFPLKAEYGDVLTFPLKDLPPCEPITWSNNNKDYSKIYYKLRAWFNKPVPKGTEMNVHLEKAQEIDLWVAEEYIHPRYKDGPMFAKQHLLNGLDSVPNSNGDKVTSLYTVLGLELDWAVVFLNEAFFYGQRKGDENDRFIIYHPPRDIYQARFKKDTKQTTLEAIGNSVPSISVMGNKLTMTPQKVNALSNLLVKAFGDQLHQFIPPALVKDENTKVILK